MFKTDIKYKKIELDVVNEFVKHIPEDHKDHDDIVFFIANIHQWKQTKFEFWNVDQINDLLDRNNLDVSVFENTITENKDNPTINIFDKIVEFIFDKQREYKSELISYVKSKDQMVKTSAISNQIKKMIDNGILESVSQSGQSVLSKGRYWNTHIKGER
tara:strand:- start:61 stop:537 length:477 start_codon:yes stop_codon:yes gene_type:complete